MDESSTLSVGRLFGFGGSSTHSYYPCVIGCGEENFTPDKYQYYTPNQLDNEGKPQAPISNYYHENFEVTKVKKDKDGKEIKVKEMTINMELLQNNNKPKNNIPSIDMSALKGDD